MRKDSKWGHAVIGSIEAELQHYGIDHGDGRCGHGNAAEPACHRVLSQNVAGSRRAAKNGTRKLIPPSSRSAGDSADYDLGEPGRDSQPTGKTLVSLWIRRSTLDLAAKPISSARGEPAF